MFVHSHSLPHRLPPTAYHAVDFHERELRDVFHQSWQLVGTTEELARPGDFLTVNLWGHRLQVRNFDGRIVALSNVCAHRHCLISSQARGHSPRMRCQYHGWEYGADGKTGRIPEPRNFVPHDRESHQLPAYRTALCGQLVFVSLAADGPSLEESLGSLYDHCQERFGEPWRRSLTWEADYPCNWKVPIENSLEAYHVACVHPESFREAPPESASQHVLGADQTAFGTTLPFSTASGMDEFYQRCEGVFLRWLGATPTRAYWQHHCFPNLLFSFTDAISLCHGVVPVSPVSCRAIVRQFGRGGGRGLRRLVAAGWGRMAGSITRRIVTEDMGLFAAIQAGLEASPQAGVLGRCEERIHQFHLYLERTMHGAEQARGGT